MPNQEVNKYKTIHTNSPSTVVFPCAVMSKWLNDDEVLVGQGSGEAAPVSPRLRGPSAGSPRLRGLSAGSPSPSQGVCSPRASPRAREAGSGSPKAETMGKAKELFVLCDKQGKGFITKWDMQVSSWRGGRK